jgi:hypothetical protein
MENKNDDTLVLTPLGFISYPRLDKPGGDGNKYSASLFIEKEKFKTEGQALLKAVLMVGQSKKGANATLRDFKHTIYDVDNLPADKRAKLPEVVRSGYIQINTASTTQPVVKDALQKVMSPVEITKIAGGDVCRFVVRAYWYDRNGGGVGLGLNVVQYKEPGPVKFGGGSAGVELLSNLEVATTAAALAGTTANSSANNELGL